MADVGFVSLLIALALAIYSVVGCIIGQIKKIPALVESARHATFIIVLALTVSTLSLVAAFISNDFEVAYVFSHSNLDMPRGYTWVAFYAGNEGSLLFIATVL